MILHGYWRSGTSYRTRIALNLKGLEISRRRWTCAQGRRSPTPTSGSIRKGWSRRWKRTTAWS